jgi:hypothetical protein
MPFQRPEIHAGKSVELLTKLAFITRLGWHSISKSANSPPGVHR